MRRMVGATLLPLVLAGCASGGDLFHQEPAKPAAPAAEAVPQGLPQQATPRSNLSPAAMPQRLRQMRAKAEASSWNA
jgi:hypothetical protein